MRVLRAHRCGMEGGPKQAGKRHKVCLFVLTKPQGRSLVGAPDLNTLANRLQVRRLAGELGAAGHVIVSGLARGIDAAPLGRHNPHHRRNEPGEEGRTGMPLAHQCNHPIRAAPP